MNKLILIAAFVASACGGGGGSGDAKPELVDRAMLENFADKIAVPTYQDMAAKAKVLSAAVAALTAEPSQAALDATRAAWVATRVPWEQSEAFLFGPVETNGYDAGIDSWPLNKTDLDGVLASANPLDATFIATLANNQKGFHTVEYLIFGESGTRAPSEITAREFEYLAGSAKNVEDVAVALEASWAVGVEGKPAYRGVFVAAGDAGNTIYPSLSAAGQELVQGMIGICDEVAEGKIATPFDAQNENLVESQFSFNSLQDFSDNMRGVESVYNGALQGQTAAAGLSISSRIAGVDPALDAKVKLEISDSIAKILLIPSPFPVSLKVPANAPAIKAAQEATRKLRDTLTFQVLPLVAG